MRAYTIIRPTPPEATLVDGRLLIDAGESGVGGSFHEYLLRCPQRFAYRYILELEEKASQALSRGALVHVGCSHYEARLQARQQGWTGENGGPPPATAYHDPITAVAVAGRQRGATEAYVVTAQRAVNRYMNWRALEERRYAVLAIEHRVSVTFAGVREVLGEPYGDYSVRYDLVLQGRDGRIYVEDHKTTGGVVDGRKKAAFTLSISILGLQKVGRMTYGEKFGGVRLNMISLRDDCPPVRIEPQIAPHALRQFEQTVLDRQYALDALKKSGRDPWNWPKALSEQGPCMDRYGPCPFRDHCRFGPGEE